MDVFKTYLFFSDYDQGYPHLVDTIEYEGAWWLVGSWIESRDTKARWPKQLVRLTGLVHQEVEKKPYRFLLTNSIPKSVLDGKAQDGFVLATYPALADIPGPRTKH